MARYMSDNSHDQLFVSGSLESLLPAQSVARVIWEALGDFDFSSFDAGYCNDEEGRPAVDPRRATAVWLLAVLRGISSSVTVAELCGTDIEFRWISGDCGVKKSTLSHFRKGHIECLGALSTQVLAALSRSGMLPGESVAVDGSVIRAAASCRSALSGKQLRRRLERLEGVIKEKLEDSDDDGDDEGVKRLQRRRARFEQALAELSRSGHKRVTVSDFEASVKRLKNHSFAPAHNVQVVSDLSSGAIISAVVVDKKSDQGQLLPQVRHAEKELCRVAGGVGAKSTERGYIRRVVADAAYHDTQQLVTLSTESIEAFVPDDQKRHRLGGISEAFQASSFVYDSATDTMVCPGGHRLRRRKLNNEKTAVTYEAEASVCQSCPCKVDCCPRARGGRSVNRPLHADVLWAVHERTVSARGGWYRRARKVVAEGVFGRLFGLLHWRRCRTWGQRGARAELLWHQLAHNLMLLLGQWQPLVPRGPTAG